MRHGAHPILQAPQRYTQQVMSCHRAFDGRSLRGFTLAELMLVVALVGILASLAYASYGRYVTRARNASAVADLGRIRLLIERYRLNHNDAIPLSLADIGADTMKDPWGHAYKYLNFSTVVGPGQKRKDRNLVPINSQYDLYSNGADGLSVPPLTAKQSQDDIIVANDGAFVGLASDY